MRRSSLLLVALSSMAFVLTVRAETVYDFVSDCRADRLAHCYSRIESRLLKLNEEAGRRVCLPRSFGATLAEPVSIPVSLLEHIRLALSAARFGNSEVDVDEAIVGIVAAIYRCE